METESTLASDAGEQESAIDGDCEPSELADRLYKEWKEERQIFRSVKA